MAGPEDREQTLIEQYKLYVELADRVSARRVETSKFHLGLVTGLLAIVPFAVSEAQKVQLTTTVLVIFAVMGLLLCAVWTLNIVSYKQLNSLKFKVIHEMENQLPYACFDREWQILRNNPKEHRYLRLSFVERFVPLVLTIPYVVILVLTLIYRP